MGLHFSSLKYHSTFSKTKKQQMLISCCGNEIMFRFLSQESYFGFSQGGSEKLEGKLSKTTKSLKTVNNQAPPVCGHVLASHQCIPHSWVKWGALQPGRTRDLLPNGQRSNTTALPGLQGG